jgi:hypothetical protein
METPGWTHEDDRFLDRLDRVTWRVARCFMLGVPVWFLLLLAVPSFIPVGPMPSLILATLGAAGACWLLERWVRRNRRPPSADEPLGAVEPEARRRPGATRLLIAGAIALFLVYGLLVILAGGGR